MQVQLTLKKTSHREITLNESFLEETSLKSSRSSAQSQSFPKLKKQPSVMSPLKLAKNRVKKNETYSNISVDQNQSTIRPDQPQEFKITQPQNNDFVFNKYDIRDLTYSLVIAKINKTLLLTLFIIQVIVRYFSILSLIYITLKTYSEQWAWVFILVCTNTIYFICIVKVSLKPAETQSEFILKQSFNSLEENQASDYFQVISPKKFLTSVLRGMVPPEFSFCYIKDSERRTEIYAMINYMYSSIQAVIYYPFFIIYMMVIIRNQKGLESSILFLVSLGLICLSEITFVIFSGYLVVFGCRKKGYLKVGKEK